MDEFDEGVRVTRWIEADAETLWHDFTTAEGLEQWWWPMFDDTRYEIEFGEEGWYRIRSASGGVGVQGRYQDIAENVSYSCTWDWDGEDETSRVEVVFDERDGGTLVTVTQSARGDEIGSLTDGWEDCLTRLEELHADA